MKKKLTKFIILMVAAPVVTGLALGWLFSLDGTLGMSQSISQVQFLFIAVGVLGCLGPIFALVRRGSRILKVVAIVFATLGILVPLAIGGFFLRSTLAYAPTTPPLLLIMDGVGTNGIPNVAITFRTAQETRNTVYYGEESLNQQYEEPAAVTEHVLPLKNLKPGAHYVWKLNDEGSCSFETPSVQSPSSTLYHFGVGGDAHLSASLTPPNSGDSTVLSGVLNYVIQPANQFNTFFMLGDTVNMGSSFEDWQHALGIIAPFSCSVPLRPLMGNHDSYFNGAPQYMAYLYPAGMELQNGTRTYYRIDAGRVHFIMLKMLWGADSFSVEQRAWFIKQMESIPPDDWKIVMMHSMVYASGSVIDGHAYYDPADMVQQVAPLLEKYKVDLVISGHDHDLEFLQKNGVNYAVVGGLGAPLNEVATYNSPASVWYDPQQYGFLDVTVHPAAIELHFRDPQGNELKSFSIGKNQ